MSGLKVLLVDDQPAILAALSLLFDVRGIPTLVAKTPEQALELVRSEEIGVVLQDMNFSRDATSGAEGESLLAAIRALDPDLPVVLMTAFQSLEAAVRLVRAGASDYIAKPWDDDKLLATVKNLMRLRELSRENLRFRSTGSRARAELAREHELCGLVYASSALHQVVSLAAKVAPSDAAVLITGPNGSGKELIAQIIQANSRRKKAPFVRVNAGGLPDSLLEAELFGAEAGAYTGASKLRIGRFEEASGGTLFLDELGNLSMQGQMKLLRVLQTGEFQRLGSNVTRKTDVRLISATNADLPAAIRAGSFREDLYFRLNVIELHIPPLRSRPDDILPIAELVLARHTKSTGQAFELSPDARRALVDHEWPGNVRELENRLQRATLVCEGPRITSADLGLEGTLGAALAASPVPATSSGTLPAPAAPRVSEARESLARESAPPESAPREAAVPVVAGSPPPEPVPPEPPRVPEIEAQPTERAELERILVESGGVISTAAAMLGISRQALYRRMDRLGITVERRVRG
ncbi:MAG TPA: sigma-54 dependent transcriptional regulator [Polyangiaceae bacterium]|nr:sigma-54 dependent transcriptional regulator [Polyangiaceae bacterium]